MKTTSDPIQERIDALKVKIEQQDIERELGKKHAFMIRMLCIVMGFVLGFLSCLALVRL